MSERTERTPIDLGPPVAWAKVAKGRAEVTPKGPWIALDAPRVVYGDNDHGIDRVIVVFGLTTEARTITSFVSEARVDVPALADSVLAMADEITYLREGLLDMAERLDREGVVLDPGPARVVSETATALRVLTGEDPKKPPFKLFRIVGFHDLYVARSAKHAAKLWGRDVGDEMDETHAHQSEAEEVTENPLTLLLAGFDRPAPPPAATSACDLNADRPNATMTLTQAEWLEGIESDGAGLFWAADR